MKTHTVQLTDDDIIMLVTGLDLIARNLGEGQRQTGLAGIKEVRDKSAPIEAMADRLQKYLPKKPGDEHQGPPAADQSPRGRRGK